MTNREKAIVTCYTGITMFQGKQLKYLYDYLEEICGFRPITSEIPLLLEDDYVKFKIYTDFINLCKESDD